MEASEAEGDAGLEHDLPRGTPAFVEEAELFPADDLEAPQGHDLNGPGDLREESLPLPAVAKERR